jgi:hypothetical protein
MGGGSANDTADLVNVDYFFAPLGLCGKFA